MNNKLDFNKLFKIGKEIGFNSMKVYITSYRDMSFNTFNKKIENYNVSNIEKYSVSGIIDKKLGVLSLEKLEESDFIDVAKSLKEIIENVDNKDEQFIYPGDKNYNLYSTNLDNNVSIEDKFKRILNLTDLAKERDSRIKTVHVYYGESEESIRIINSYGLDIEETKANCDGVIITYAKSGKKVSNESKRIYGLNYHNINFEKLLDEVVHNTIDKLNADTIDTKKYKVIFENHRVIFLFHKYLRLFMADNIQQNRSLLKDKLNTKIFGDNITLIEDPQNKDWNYRSFDEEGVKTQYKEIVKDGVLKTYLYDLKTAYKDNVKSTGNGGLICNVYLKPGKITLEEMIKNIDEGIFINKLIGMHGINTVNGDFSLSAEGYLIKNGKLDKALKQIVVSGNFIDMLSNVEAIGNDLLFDGNSFLAPSIQVKELTVAGK